MEKNASEAALSKRPDPALRAEGFPVTDEATAHLTPAQHDHINFYGTYDFDIDCGSPEIVEGFLCRFRLGLGFPDLVVDG